MTLPKLIASDLDGTLLTEGTRVLSERALSLITEYIARGGVFTAASGRQPENMFDVFSPIRDKIGYVCYSGGLCLYQGRVIYEKHIEPSLALELINDIENSHDSEAMVSVLGSELISPKEPQMYRYLTQDVGAYTTVTDSLREVKDGIFKVSLYNKDGNIDRDYWKARYGSRCAALDSGSVWMDFIPHGVNKGSSLKALLDHLGISPADCMAFGDNENDKDMLRLVGTPVVMAHSAPHIRALGKYTTGTVEDMLEQLLR